jgi:hypothetical protein
MSKERFDIHQHITHKIVNAIERDFACPGIAPPAAPYDLASATSMS